MMIRSITLLLVFLPSIPTLSAQEPVQPYDANGRYGTAGIEAQLTGSLGGRARRAAFVGALLAGGRSGRWMQRTELAAGVHAGQNMVDRLMVGPQVSLGLAIPPWYTLVEGGRRAEPYLLLNAGAYGVANFRESQTELGLAPTVGFGVGFRIFEDEWDIALTQLEVLVQRPFGVIDQAPQLYVRLSRALPRRDTRRPATPHPDGPGVPPPPRHR